MNLRQLASFIARQEGKKHQASIGDIREILRILVEREEICYRKNLSARSFPSEIITRAGKKRANRKLKRKKKLD